MEKKQITIKEALEQGYTHYTLDGSGVSDKISNLNEDDLKYGWKYLLLEKIGKSFSIDADTIQDILGDYILNQDEFYSEDDTLHDELAEADFDKMAELVNVGFKTLFRFPTEIELIP